MRGHETFTIELYECEIFPVIHEYTAINVLLWLSRRIYVFLIAKMLIKICQLNMFLS